MSPFYADTTEQSTSPKPDIADIIDSAAAAYAPTSAPTGQTQLGTPYVTPSNVSGLGPNDLGGDFMPISEETIVEMETDAYLESIKDQEVSTREIRDQLLANISKAFTRETMRRDGDKQRTGADHPKIAKPRTLDELTCVKVLLARNNIAAIDFANGEGEDDLVELGIWSPPPADLNKCSRDHGIYATGERPLKRLISQLKPGASANAVTSTLATLKAHAPIKMITRTAHLRAVNNGIFNNKTQELEPFTPDYVAIRKIPVNYNPDAEDREITMPDGKKWTFETWLQDLTDDEGVYELLWEGIAAVVWPYFKRSKALFLHSNQGLNGKGTYCHLLENILGGGGSTPIRLTKFGDQFALTNLLRAQAIITHENAVNEFSNDLSDFKAVATADKFVLNRKNKNPLDAVFVGPIFQCVNDFPKTRDKSNSIARRQLWIPFTKSYKGDDVERDYIKEDYLGRKDVLEYVLLKALQMPLAKFSEPQVCLDLMEEAKRENNAVREFWYELEDEFVWDLLPTPFLYALFIAWFRRNHPSGIPVGRTPFISSLSDVLADNKVWDYEDKNKKHRPGQKMIQPEELIAEYDLKEWFNISYSGTDATRKSAFIPNRDNYQGVVRRDPATNPKHSKNAVDTDSAVSD